MNDPDQVKQQEHWDELARQLGLEPESAQPPKPAAARVAEAREKPPEPRPVQAPIPKEHPADRAEIRSQPIKPDRQEMSRPPEKIEQREVPEDLSRPDDEARGQPQRQGRRGRRSSQHPRSNESDRRDVSRVEERKSEGSERRKSRSGSGRRGRKNSPESEPAEFAAIGDKDPDSTNKSKPTVEADNDLDDLDTLSNWNVPSWAELIGSLYRPER